MIQKILLLLLLAILTFANALRNPFMLDDYGFFGMNAKQPIWSFFIPDRNAVLGLGPERMERSYYRPLAHAIPLSCHRLFKNDPFGYHVVNALLLWLTACVLLLFLRRWGNFSPQVSILSDHNGRWAFLISALFIIHPINGIMVNYITASVFAAQVAFMLISLVLLQGHQCPSTPGSRKIDSWGAGTLGSWGSIVFFILALFCHETALILPAYALLVLRTKFSWRDSFKAVIPLLVVAVVYLIARSFVSPFNRSILHSLSILDLSLPEKIASIVQLLSWYFQKLLWPKDIFLMFSAPFIRDGVWWWIVPTAGSVIIASLILYRWARQHLFSRFFVWFLLGLTPLAAGAFVTPYLGALIEPHWFIFGSIGFLGMVVCVLAFAFPRRAQIVMVVLLMVGLIGLSWRNNHLWSNEVRYYTAWLKETPDFKAVHYFLGLTYQRNRQWDLALEHLKRSVVGRYKDWMVYLELGQIEIQRKKWDQAEEYIRRAYTLENNDSRVLNAAGAVFYHRGEFEQAKDFWLKAVKRNPYNFEPQMNLAIYYQRTGQPQKAIDIYQHLIRLDAGYLPAQKALRRLQQKENL